MTGPRVPLSVDHPGEPHIASHTNRRASLRRPEWMSGFASDERIEDISRTAWKQRSTACSRRVCQGARER